MSSNEEEAAGQEANGATQADEAPPAGGERAGDRRPPVATRFKPGQSGNPRGRPRVKRHLGAVVARALRERVTVEETDGRVRRLSKLEAMVKQIVDGATKGDARATRLLFALIKADERALTEAEGRSPGGLASEADAIVIAELRRRLAGDRLSRARRLRAEGAPPPPPPPRGGGGGGGGGRPPGGPPPPPPAAGGAPGRTMSGVRLLVAARGVAEATLPPTARVAGRSQPASVPAASAASTARRLAIICPSFPGPRQRNPRQLPRKLYWAPAGKGDRCLMCLRRSRAARRTSA
jgi:hypothetical protein